RVISGSTVHRRPGWKPVHCQPSGSVPVRGADCQVQTVWTLVDSGYRGAVLAEPTVNFRSEGWELTLNCQAPNFSHPGTGLPGATTALPLATFLPFSSNS